MYMLPRRRDFLSGTAALFGFGTNAWAVPAEGGSRRLIVILLRGAVDGLHVPD